MKILSQKTRKLAGADGRSLSPGLLLSFFLTVFFALSAIAATALDAGEPSREALFRAALSDSDNHQVAASLAHNRRATLGLFPSTQMSSPTRVRDFLFLASRNNLEEIAFFLKPLSEFEEKLFNKVVSLRPPVVSRTNFANLRFILGQKGLLSPVEAARRRLTVNKTITPDLEEVLYGAYGCVFASVGPIDGTERYGEVIIRLKDSVKSFGWGTPWSGHYFFKTIRGRAPKQINQDLQEGLSAVSADDFVHFSRFVSIGRHWNESLAWQAVNYLRDTEDASVYEKRRQAAEALIAETDYRRFWELFVADYENVFGYIEARFPGYIAAEYFESIEVPADRLKEVLSWPEARPFRNRIKAAR